MNQEAAAELAATVEAETEMDASPVHLRRGDDGWVVAAYLDDDPDNGEVVVVGRTTGGDGYEVTADGGDDTGYARTPADLFRELLSRRERHATSRSG